MPALRVAAPATVGQDGRSYDMGNDSIAIYDISGGAFELLESVELADEPNGNSGIGFSEDSRFAYIGTHKRQSANPKLYEISLEAPYGVTRSMEFPEALEHIGPTRCVGNRVFMSDAANLKMWVVDRSSWTKIGYALESAPAALEVHPSGAYLFVLMPDIGTVVAIDTSSMSIVARFDGLSTGAHDIEFNNDGTEMYVAHSSSVGEIMVFDLDCGCGPVGETCPVDFEKENGQVLIHHGPGACENTEGEPGPSVESYSTSLPSTVSPGEPMTFSVDWNRCDDCNPNAVIYSSFLGDWALDQPLQVSSSYFTTCEETATDGVTFTAPDEPGLYRVRWIMCFAFDAIRNFCGEAYTGDAWDPGTCPYVERTFTVRGCGNVQCDIAKSDDFEDGMIDPTLWAWGGLNRATFGGPGGSWQWSHEEVIDPGDGYLRMRVWGPTSGNTFGAEAWVRTLYDFNDGANHLINFAWEAAVQDGHYNHYHIQVTDGYIPPDGNPHWPFGEAPIPGTTDLLWRLSGEAEVPGASYPSGLPKSAWSMTIAPSGLAVLYDGPDASGSVIRSEPLDPAYAWYVRFMTLDGTSAGFTAGDISLNLYDFCATTVADSECGNGVVDTNEVCDDGNQTNGDGCDDDTANGGNCTPTACGNGVITIGEICDDGDLIDDDGCDSNCTVTSCGNGVVTAGEECDDSNNDDYDGCSAECIIADFKYRCVILDTPSTEDQKPDLPSGMPSVPADEPFYVEFWATDSELTNSGVVSAYADLEWTEGLINCESITNAVLFDLFPGGTCDDILIDELGGSQLESGIAIAPEWARVAYAEFTPDAIGPADFSLLPAATESSAHGRGLVPPVDIDYGTCTVEVVCPCIYDLDDNCNIAGGDLGLFAPCWSLCEDDPDWDTFGCGEKDFDCNGCVSGGDLGWFAGAWQKTCDLVDPIADYPECRQCDGPVYCPGAVAGRGTEAGGDTNSKSVARANMAAPSVLLSLQLREPNDFVQPSSRLDRGRLATFERGEHLVAEIWAKDISPTSDGLTVVFTDLFFDPSQFEVVSIDSGDTFTLFAAPSIATNDGVVRGVGGATLESTKGAGTWIRVAVVELVALEDIARPTVSIRPSEGEAVSRYGQGLVPTEQVRVAPKRLNKRSIQSLQVP